MALIITLALCFGTKDAENISVSSIGGADSPERTYRTVQLLEKKSDNIESAYEVVTYLNGTDFSYIGQELIDKIEQEWNIYSAMIKEQRIVSDHLWGFVSVQVDTWDECKEIIGFDAENPLESIDWLNRTGYLGTESVDAAITAKHINISANYGLNTDRKVRDINVTAGYDVDDIQITLNATICADNGPCRTGSVCNGYATYEEESVTTGSDIPVLIVTTNESNNTGYYNDDYYDPTAYWVKNNVLYTLRVFGKEANKDEILAALYRILGEV